METSGQPVNVDDSPDILIIFSYWKMVFTYLHSPEKYLQSTKLYLTREDKKKAQFSEPVSYSTSAASPGQ
jgi:hypothetical protein